MHNYIEVSGQITWSCGQKSTSQPGVVVSKLAHTAAHGDGLVTRDSIYIGS